MYTRDCIIPMHTRPISIIFFRQAQSHRYLLRFPVYIGRNCTLGKDFAVASSGHQCSPIRIMWLHFSFISLDVWRKVTKATKGVMCPHVDHQVIARVFFKLKLWRIIELL
jgi:hypothetical protein